MNYWKRLPLQLEGIAYKNYVTKKYHHKSKTSKYLLKGMFSLLYQSSDHFSILHLILNRDIMDINACNIKKSYVE